MAVSPRLGQRFNPVGLSCRLGDVIDLSASGARVRSLSKPALAAGDGIKLHISNGTSRLELRARVVWVRRARESKMLFDVGVQFTELTPELTESIIEMARFGFIRPKAAPASGPSAGAKAASSTGGTPHVDAPKQSGNPKSSASESGPKSGATGSVTASMEVEDLYAVLGVPAIATSEQIHGAFRALARTLHPDRNKAADANQQFARISKAYSVLRDPALRARYDAMLNSADCRAA